MPGRARIRASNGLGDVFPPFMSGRDAIWRFAEHIAETDYGDLPESAAAATRTFLLDTLELAPRRGRPRRRSRSRCRRPSVTRLSGWPPARWEDTSRTPGYAFFPFGGGVRHCLGAAFATYEMKIVLARVLSRVTLRPDPDYAVRVVRRGLALGPSSALPVIRMAA